MLAGSFRADIDKQIVTGLLLNVAHMLSVLILGEIVSEVDRKR